MEMEMRAREDVGIGQDITPPLPPLSFALHDSFLHSHCSACFSVICSSSPTRPTAAGTATAPSPFVTYCSAKCASIDSSLHFSSAEHHLYLLLRLPPSCPSVWQHGDSSDLRASLRLLRLLELLHMFPTPSTPLPDRIAGLMTNRKRLASSREEELESNDCLVRLRDGARVMAMARAMRDGRDFDGDCELEEAVMCIVLTNAVEVQVVGQKALGIAVYDGRFSWINHSCSPNACYRFRLKDLKSPDCASLRIASAANGILIEDDSVYKFCELAKGCSNHGPRLVARSIHIMKRGDQVTVTYTDLLQPRMLRQSELWFKYQFFCSCIRCNAVPMTYVDHALQETFLVDHNMNMISSVSRDKFVEELTDFFDSVISEYLSAGNPVSCCEKIDNLLTRGLVSGDLYPKKPSIMDFRLSPVHHLCLSAYTTLCSAYKIRADLAENSSKAFSMSRFSSAYSLLLAGATHHLFLSEPSLIASAANLWTDAGQSLVSLARSSFWPSSLEQSSSNSLSLASLVCDNCLLIDKFEANFSCWVSEYEKLDEISQCFLRCTTNIVHKAWNFLVQDCHYLTQIKDPISFSWLEALRTSNVWGFRTQLIHDELCSSSKRNSTGRGEHRVGNEGRTNTFLLGAHCLIYGVYLSGVCYGQDSSPADDLRKVLYG